MKKKEREAVAGGKKPYFLKGSEKKRLSLEQRCAEVVPNRLGEADVGAQAVRVEEALHMIDLPV